MPTSCDERARMARSDRTRFGRLVGILTYTRYCSFCQTHSLTRLPSHFLLIRSMGYVADGPRGAIPVASPGCCVGPRGACNRKIQRPPHSTTHVQGAKGIG